MISIEVETPRGRIPSPSTDSNLTCTLAAPSPSNRLGAINNNSLGDMNNNSLGNMNNNSLGAMNNNSLYQECSALGHDWPSRRR